MQDVDRFYQFSSSLRLGTTDAPGFPYTGLPKEIEEFTRAQPPGSADLSETGGPTAFIRTDLLDQSEIAILRPDWEDLCSRSLEDTVYYAPGYASSLLETTARRDGVKFIATRYGSRLTGLLPVTTTPIAVPGLIPAGSAWTTDYTFTTTPLIDRNMVNETVVAMVQGLQDLKQSEWVLPLANLDGPCCKAFIDAFQRLNIPWSVTRSFERASVSPASSYDDYMNEHVSSKRRSELRRYRRRLEELGQVRHQVFTSGDSLGEAVKIFLDLEASGWKGARRTALACRGDTQAFALSAFQSFNANARCRVDVLSLNNTPIAAGIIVFAGNTGFTVKNAYDEAYSKYGAGLLLEIEVLKSLMEEKWAARLDAATSGSHVVDQLWPDRNKVASLVFSLAPHLASSSTASALALNAL